MAAHPVVELRAVLNEALSALPDGGETGELRYAAACSMLTPAQRDRLAGHLADRVWDWLSPDDGCE
jgi:hypothetical protein